MPKFNRRRFAIIFMFALLSITALAFIGVFSKNLFAADYTGLGEERFSWTREVYDGVDLTNVISYNSNKDQKTYTLSFNPKTVNLKPIIAYGGNAMYGSTMTSLIDYEESLGNHVVFGINGDAYDTSNGVANGLVINNGELITSSGASMGWGMLSDGTVKYGSASLQMRATIVGGDTINLRHVNKERKLDTNGVYLLTEKFNSVTASTESGVEVVLDIIDEHKDLGLKIGKTLSAKVASVNIVDKNPNKNQTAIGKNQVVLATHTNSPEYAKISELAVGTQIDFNVNDVSDDRIDWSQIQVGMGIFHLLMENGVATSAIDDPAVHPRTSMGIKADGSIVLMQNDGRQFGWANGLSFKEMIEYMKTLGVVTLFNFDGGGSSTIQVTMPGEDRTRILNRPSDGNERANTNALLFIAKEEPVEGNPVEELHLYPGVSGNYSTKTMLLEKSNLKFNLKATDRHFYKSSLEGKTVTYSIENETGSNIGTITNDGVFKANAGTGKGKVVASVGDLKASYDIQLVDSITSMETDLTILSIAPGKTVAMDFRAYNNSVPVMLSNESLTFTLDPASLGTVSANGVFTATSGQGTGNLSVAYKDYTFTLPVEIGKMPAEIIDFETDIFDSGSWSRYYTNIPGNGGAGEITINRDERYIKHGDGSLRIDYDFATKPLTGTVAIEIGKSGYITLEGQPTAIGAWVYGDGNGGWFRIQLSGGKYAGDTYIDWVGWRYIETPIPTDAPFPYVVQRPVRLLGTAKVANNKKGTIYVDSVRAIYDFKNDDNDAPVVETSSIYPAQGATTAYNQQPIGLKVRDVEGDGKVYTGIDTTRTQMYINNKLITNIQQTVNKDGSVDIAYVPGALDLLRPGVQKVKVRTEDNFGNKTFTEWSFTLEGYAVSLVEDYPARDKIFAGEVFDYKLTTPSYKNFASAELELSYNFKNLTLLDTVVDSRLTVTEKVIDPATGKVKLTILGMDSTAYNKDIDFVTLKFKAKDTVDGTTGIKVDVAKVLEGNTKTDLYLTGFDVPMDYKNILSFKGSTVGGSTVLTVVSGGEPVVGAGFIVKKAGEDFAFTGVTDANGKLTTAIFGTNPTDTEFTIRAIKDNFLSNEIKFKVVPSLGSAKPEKISVTVGEDASTSVGIGFQTSHDVKNAKVIYSTNADLTGSKEVAATSKVVQTTNGGIDREYTSWGAYVTGLTANTKYYYKVGTDAGWSDVLTFTTPGASGDANIAFFGDIQGGYANFPKVVAEANKLYPDIDLNMLAGDVSDNAHVYQEWSNLDSYSKQYFNNNIWMATIGNHDTSDGGQAFTGYFYGPNNGVEEPNGGARNYWFEINNAVVFNFDTEAGFNSYDPNYTKQIALLKQVMNASDKTFKIVIMHRSAYPVNYNEANIRALAPVFEEAEVDLVLSGHDHVYNRTTMLEGSKVEVQNGITYVVAGSGSGSKYYGGDATRPWVNVMYDNDNPVFSILKLRNGTDLVFEAYAVESTGTKKIDEFTITKFEVDATISEGASLVGSKYAKVGSKLNYAVDVQEGYILTSVKVDGKDIEFNDNKFTVQNVTESTKIDVQVEELIGPYATNISIEGKFLSGSTLEAKYTYNNTNSDAESGTLISWYVDGNKVADGKTVKLLTEWVGKTIQVRVTAKSTKETGIEVRYTSTEVIELFGDLNADNVVTKDDAYILLQSITGKVTLTADQKYYANVTDEATLKDVRNILAAIGGK